MLADGEAAQMSETMQVPKKQVAAWFKSIADLAAKETKRTGQFIIPGIGKLVKAQRKGAQGTQPPDRRTDSNPVLCQNSAVHHHLSGTGL